MAHRLALLLLGLSPASAAALDLRETGRYDLNRPASLDYDPAFCGLWIANEGPEAVLVTLQGEELRRVGSDLTRIKAIAVEGDDLLVGDGLGRLQRLTKDGEPLGAPFALEGGPPTPRASRSPPTAPSSRSRTTPSGCRGSTPRAA